MPSPNEIDLTVVVNGQPVPVKANIQAPLRTLIEHALQQSGNSGQPLDNWELRDASGKILNPDSKIGEFNFSAGTQLFLNLKAGVGG